MFQPHAYGDHVHVLAEPYLLSLLARISSPESDGERLPDYVRAVYRRLLEAVLNEHFPTEETAVSTRMAAADERGVYVGPCFRPDRQVVVCAVLRGGVVPAQLCYEAACRVLPHANVRLDFVYAARETGENGEVTGVRLDGSRIGGSVKDALLLIPDPMGATGRTVESVLELYREHDADAALGKVAMHLIAAPEAIQRVTKHCPDTHLWTCRVDRGASPAEVLGTRLGAHPDLERGLNERQYILPGAGGLGEALTNAHI